MNFLQNIKLSWEAGGVINRIYVVLALIMLTFFVAFTSIVLYFIPQLAITATVIWFTIKGFGKMFELLEKKG